MTEVLQSIVGDNRFWIDENMARHTTFRAGGNADYYVVADTVEQLQQVLEVFAKEQIPVYMIGNGSNLLVTDGGYRGAIVELGEQFKNITKDGMTFRAGAGVMLSKVSNEAKEHSMTGLEFASGIPGTLGGAIVMNAGAYDGEMKDVVTSVKVLTPEGAVKELVADELELSYRHSIIPQKQYIVLEVTMELAEGDKEQINAKMQDFNGRRRDKQPLEYPSAGSTFKRPQGHFAGKLIQDSGLSGYTVGGACVSEKHCGFVINKNNASASDILQVINDVQKVVEEKFGVTMKPEVKILGE